MVREKLSRYQDKRESNHRKTTALSGLSKSRTLGWVDNLTAQETEEVANLMKNLLNNTKSIFIDELKINKTYSTHTITIYSNYIQNFIYLKPYTVVGSFRGPQPVFIYDQADAFFAGGDYSWKVDLSKNTKGTKIKNR